MQKYKVFVNNKPIIISDEWENFISNFQLVVAAGGYVKNKKAEILFIKRNGINQIYFYFIFEVLGTV